MRNHGIIATANTIEGALYFYLCLEKACRIQLLVDAASTRGPPVLIDPEEAKATSLKVGSSFAGWLNGLIEYELLEAEEGASWKGKD